MGHVTIEFANNEDREAASRLLDKENIHKGVSDENNYSSGAYSGSYNKLDVNLEEAENLSKIREISGLYGGKVSNT
jgi:hypothetical protein